jgi:hypothetical protein
MKEIELHPLQASVPKNQELAGAEYLLTVRMKKPRYQHHQRAKTKVSLEPLAVLSYRLSLKRASILTTRFEEGLLNMKQFLQYQSSEIIQPSFS